LADWGASKKIINKSASTAKCQISSSYKFVFTPLAVGICGSML
jgi:hypothetical protein